MGEMADHDAEVFGFAAAVRNSPTREVRPTRTSVATTLRNQIAALAAEAARIEALPREPDAKAIRFRKRYDASGQGGQHWYSYAAVRVRPDLWYVTGLVTRGFTWDQLLHFIGDEHLHTIRVATGWRKLTDPE